jgi:hypothetical protein
MRVDASEANRHIATDSAVIAKQRHLVEDYKGRP